MRHSNFTSWRQAAAGAAAALALISSASLVARPRPSGQDGPIKPVIPVTREPQSSPVCHGALITGFPADAPTLAVAQSQAINLWSVKVVQNVGQGMSNWANAQQKTLQCNPGNIAGTQTCTAKANPCMPA